MQTLYLPVLHPFTLNGRLPLSVAPSLLLDFPLSLVSILSSFASRVYCFSLSVRCFVLLSVNVFFTTDKCICFAIIFGLGIRSTREANDLEAAGGPCMGCKVLKRTASP
ncbi:hypothetical protein FB451DRAFT_271273 [Mycena latifolia]|nr:hypothetical protein FB451DRAFT_271273 [Mycena latifolia]